MTNKTRRRIRHKITMALIHRAGFVDVEEGIAIRRDASQILDLIEPDYTAKAGAGALWLSRLLSDDKWLDGIQEKVWTPGPHPVL